MTESKVFTDNFSRSFTEPGDFFQFLSDRKARSKWMTAPSRELQFEPVERGSTLGNLYMQIYDHNGAAEILEDTMENTSLLLKVDGKDYPVRSCAIKTVLERARISGHALNKVSKTVFAEILNYCMGVASGDSLIKIADEKVSAVHGGDPKDYTVMEMLPLFKATSDFLNREYPGNTFMTAHFDHSIATAIWRLDGQADKLLDTYHREIAAKGLQTEKMVPALRFSTSDVGMSGANLYPIFLVGAESRIVPLGYSIRTEHKNGVDMQYFEEQLGLVYTAYEELCKIFGQDGSEPVHKYKRKSRPIETVELPIASAEVRDNTYSNLLSLLTLCPTHQSALKERGLKSEEMERLCYRTTPTTRLKRIVTELLERGCILDGVPGFYCQKDSGQWVLDIRGSGIMLPDRNLLGQIEAIQVRLDKVYNQKFYNLTSVDQYYGTQSKCCPHYVGVHEGDEVVCLTEGVMKSDLAYSFAQGSPYECGFVGLTGIPSYSQYERALEELDSIGVKRINVMVDSDYQVKEEVRKARDRYIEMGAAAGFEMAPITWTQKQKGVDDLYKHLFRDK